MTGMNSTTPQSSRTVVVTGAGTGIGRATARAFAAEGAHVVAIGRRVEPLKETAAENDRIMPLPVDITAEGEPERIVQTVLETYGRLDVLVNNAGIVHGWPQCGSGNWRTPRWPGSADPRKWPGRSPSLPHRRHRSSREWYSQSTAERLWRDRSGPGGGMDADR